MGNEVGDVKNAAVRHYLWSIGRKVDAAHSIRPLPRVNRDIIERVRGSLQEQPQGVGDLLGGGADCPYCGQQLEEGNVNVDHVVPMNRTSGGTHQHGNLLVVCKSCNSAKSSKMLACDGGTFVPPRVADAGDGSVSAEEFSSALTAYRVHFSFDLATCSRYRKNAEELAESVAELLESFTGVYEAEGQATVGED